MDKFNLSILTVLLLAFIAGNSMADTSTNAGAPPTLYQDNYNGSRTLLRHMRKETNQAVKKAHYSSTLPMDLRVTMPISNEAQLDTLLQGLYNPKSPNYHKFLTIDQFKQQFGPSSSDTQQVINYLKSQGLTVTSQSPNGLVLNVSGTVPSVEQAFGVTINNYQKNDGTTFFTTAVDPVIPPQMVGKINSIGGLDNAVKFHSHSYSAAPAAGSSPLGSQPVITPKQIGTGPGGYIAPKDIYNAYNLNSIPSNGSGQSVALFELDGYLPSDIIGYESTFGIPNVPLQNMPVDSYSGVATPYGSPEVTLDIELLAAIAPGLNKIYVYEASNTWQAWVDEWTHLANDKDQYGNLLANIVSCSWGSPEDYAYEMIFDNGIFKQMAAQGQTVFVASGDSGAYDDGVTLSVDEPASQPYVTAVGISKLAVNADRSYSSESGSLDGGGGISADHTIPYYQQGMISSISKGSNTMRNVPDVALTADPNTSYSFYIGGSWQGYWGSSLATPIWAAFISRVDQGRLKLGQTMMGFANPLLYQMAQTNSYPTIFHDIVTGNNQFYPAVTGYDLSTGLGSFNGLNLYNSLTVSNLLPPAPTALTAVIANAQVNLNWNASQGTVSYNIKRSTVSGNSYTTIKSGVTTTSYTDSTALKGAIYYYVVTAVNAAGESLNSNEAMLVFQAPTAPGGLVASPVAAQITLSWYSVSGASYYNVKKSTSSSGPFTTVASTTSVYFLDTSSMVNGMTYYYVVTAVNSFGESPNSASVKVTLSLPAPTGILAMPGNNLVNVYWTTNAAAISYNVKRTTTSGTSYTVLKTGLTNNSFTDTTAKNGTTYYYVVSAVNAAGESPNSNQYMAVPFAPAVAPTGLSAVVNNGTVVLSWNAVSGAMWYDVSRSTVSGGPYTYIGYSNSASYTDKPTGSNTFYYVVSTYINVSGVGNLSPNSSQVSAAILAAPAGLTAVAGNNQVALSWNPSLGAVSYNVKRSTGNNASFTTLKSGVTGNSYTDTTAINGTMYYYLVTAVNASGESPSSNQLWEIPFAPAVTPNGLTAIVSTVAGKPVVNLYWNPLVAPTYESLIYYVSRSMVNGGPFGAIAAVTGTNYTDANIVNGGTYYYVVSSYIVVNNNRSMSPNSTQVIAVTCPKPAAPANLMATPGNNKVLLTWNTSTGATWYNVYRATGSGSFIPFTSVYTNTITDISVKNGTSYTYYVTAVNAGGESTGSNHFMTAPFASAAPLSK